MHRADGTLWIHSFAHGRTMYALKCDAADEFEVVEIARDRPESPALAADANDNSPCDSGQESTVQSSQTEKSGRRFGRSA